MRSNHCQPPPAMRCLLLLFGALLLPIAATGQTRAIVYRIPVTGTVEMGLAPFVERSLREAADAGAAAAVLDIDTPGGRIDAAEQIAKVASEARIPTYAFVNRRAFSAGAMIALATERIFMRPGAVIGAATPITGDGHKASEKMVSAMRSEFRALAEARGRDPRIAEAMVDEEVSIPGIVPRGKLLSLSAEEAVRIGYATRATGWDAVVAQIAPARARTVSTRPNWAERTVRFLTDPLVAPFLLSLGFLGLLVEVKTPAFGLAGLAGLGSLALFFGSHLIIGLAGWEVVILLVAGLVLLGLEAFVIPGFGVAGMLGITAVVASIFLSLIGSLPTSADYATAIGVMGAAVVIFLFVAWQLLQRLPDDRRARHLLLQTSTSREQGFVSSVSRDDLVGSDGVALTDLRPAGTATFGDERVDVVSDGGWVSAGTRVRVLRAEGYRHVVRPVA